MILSFQKTETQVLFIVTGSLILLQCELSKICVPKLEMVSLTLQLYQQHVHSLCKVSSPPRSVSNRWDTVKGLCKINIINLNASLLNGPSGRQTFLLHLMTTDVPLSSVLFFLGFLLIVHCLMVIWYHFDHLHFSHSTMCLKHSVNQ